MQKPNLPRDESERLASLRKLLLLDTPGEESFDRITRVAQSLFAVPIALVSLVDANRQWFKSCIGLPVQETGRDISFCGHAILGDDLFVIPDALTDIRFADNPLVTGAPGIRFYAGFPVKNADGHTIGTLCIIDTQPRDLTQRQMQLLRDMGGWVETVLASRELSKAQITLLQELDFVKHQSLLDTQLRVWNGIGISGIFGNELMLVKQTSGKISLIQLALNRRADMLASGDKEIIDILLLELVKLLRSSVPAGAAIGRLDGDILLIVIPGIAGDALQAICNKLLGNVKMLSDTLPDELGIQVVLSISIGAVSVDMQSYKENFCAGDLMSAANQALISARDKNTAHEEMLELFHFGTEEKESAAY